VFLSHAVFNSEKNKMCAQSTLPISLVPWERNYSTLITLTYIFAMLCLCSLEEQKYDHLSLILTALKDTAGTIVEKNRH